MIARLSLILILLALTVPAAAEEPDSFTPIARVLQSPRCQNCHPSGDAPRIGDQGRLHRMNVSRKSAESGLPCTTCHRNQNAAFEHGPPGVPNWHMPPRDRPMPFEGLTARALCEQLKDPAKNGSKSLPDLHEHFAHDALVLWAWSPGPGRTTPPISHAQLMAHVDQWIAKGGPCP
jgi:hypothetical protein